MSIEVSAYLVDWDELVKRWTRKKGLLQWFFQSIDKEPSVETYRPDGWVESWRAAVDAWLFYEDAREQISRVSRKPFDKFFRAFLASGERHRMQVRELTGKQTRNGVFDITMSPATVKEYYTLGMHLALDELRPFFEEHSEVNDLGDSHISDFDCFKRFVHQWVGLLEEASKKNKGIVVSAPY